MAGIALNSQSLVKVLGKEKQTTPTGFMALIQNKDSPTGVKG